MSVNSVTMGNAPTYIKIGGSDLDPDARNQKYGNIAEYARAQDVLDLTQDYLGHWSATVNEGNGVLKNVRLDSSTVKQLNLIG